MHSCSEVVELILATKQPKTFGQQLTVVLSSSPGTLAEAPIAAGAGASLKTAKLKMNRKNRTL